MAAIAEWRDEYLTGHATIDEQHQNLFDLVNRIHDETLQEVPSFAQVRELLSEFARCAIEHFDLEEDLMQAYRYPNYEVHTGVHQRLVTKVQRLLATLDDADATLPSDITQVITEWMVHHIRGEDRNMIRFFQQRQPVTAASQG